MKELNSYLFFNGHCREALTFYQACFDGEIAMLMTFADSPDPVPAGYEDKVMHAEFRAPGIQFMASDGMPNQLPNPGDNIHLCLNCSSKEEQMTIFNRLAAGGEITMPLQDTFWGAKFGMLKDKFAIHWMLNCEQSVA